MVNILPTPLLKRDQLKKNVDGFLEGDCLQICFLLVLKDSQCFSQSYLFHGGLALQIKGLL